MFLYYNVMCLLSHYIIKQVSTVDFQHNKPPPAFCNDYNLLFAKVLIFSETVNIHHSFFVSSRLFRRWIIRTKTGISPLYTVLITMVLYPDNFYFLISILSYCPARFITTRENGMPEKTEWNS